MGTSRPLRPEDVTKGTAVTLYEANQRERERERERARERERFKPVVGCYSR